MQVETNRLVILDFVIDCVASANIIQVLSSMSCAMFTPRPVLVSRRPAFVHVLTSSAPNLPCILSPSLVSSLHPLAPRCQTTNGLTRLHSSYTDLASGSLHSLTLPASFQGSCAHLSSGFVAAYTRIIEALHVVHFFSLLYDLNHCLMISSIATCFQFLPSMPCPPLPSRPPIARARCDTRGSRRRPHHPAAVG